MDIIMVKHVFSKVVKELKKAPEVAKKIVETKRNITRTFDILKDILKKK